MFKPGLMKCLVSAIILSSFTSLFGAYSGGSGTAADPYRIATADDLIALGATMGDYDKSFILTADIDLTGQSFTQAVIAPDTDSTNGDFQGTSFSGVFDGNRYTISNVMISATNSYIGLIGYIGSGGQVKNLGLDNVNITGQSKTGGLCGYNSGFISQCHVTGLVNGSYDTGGLCGYNSGFVSQCYVTGLVKGSSFTGGLCGTNYYYGTIDQCYATGTVTGSGTIIGGLCGANSSIINQSYANGTVTGVEDVGGLCGESFSYSITNQCYANGVVKGKQDVGGLCGFEGGAVKACFWDTQTSGQYASGSGLGLTTAQMQEMTYYSANGWAGTAWTLLAGSYPHLAWEQTGGSNIVEPVVSMTGGGSIENPFLIASVADLMEMSTGTFYWDKHYRLITNLDLAGICLNRIGYDASNAFTGSFDGNNLAITNLTILMKDTDYVGLFGYIGNKGQVKNLKLMNMIVTGRNGTGGLCGNLERGSINQCCAIGTVSGNGYVGGLCGKIYWNGIIEQCFSHGSVSGSTYIGGLCGSIYSGLISQCYTTAAVWGNSYVGGLCGDNYPGEIKQCFASGKVTGNSEYIGGLCGFGQYMVSCSFWDTQTTGQATNSGGVGLTTAQMQSLNMFSNYGWGGTVWTLPAGSYPRLAWDQAGGPYISNPIVSMEGNGSIEEPWRVATAANLVQIGNGPFYWDKHYRLTTDISLTGKSINRIGYDLYHPFIGSFDGNGHILSNLTMTMPDSAYVGLFGVMGNNGQIMNLGLVDVSVAGHNSVGGLCGVNNFGIITQAFVTGVVTGTSIDIGGLCGYNYYGTISQSYSASTVSGSDEYVGGLCGKNYYGTIDRCYTTGDVTGSADCVGGLSGINENGTINLSYTTGNISGKAMYVGGLCGRNTNGSINESFSVGTVTGNGRVGGLCGVNYAGAIQQCYAAGKITGQGDYIGGLFGRNASSTIDRCYFTGVVTGLQYVGGLCGDNLNSSTIITCYAGGLVAGIKYIGGLCGENISGCTISLSYADKPVTGDQFAGGLCGMNGGAISQCFASGSVKGASNYSSNLGGLCGSSSGTVDASFWDSQSTGQQSSGGGTGKTTAEMHNITTFESAGWDSSSTDGDRADWIMLLGGYPRLFWQATSFAPSVAGLSMEDAQTILHATGLPDAITEEYNNGFPFGTIIRSIPAEGTEVLSGSQVTLVLSLGTRQGDGTAANPYQISSNYHWILFAKTQVDWNKSLILTTDLDFGGAQLTPVAPVQFPVYSTVIPLISFTGTFDGAGHVIRNFKMDLAGQNGVGLFSCVGTGGVIKNLGVENAAIAGYRYAGSLAGYNYEGQISQCYAKGTVTGYSTTGVLVGGNYYGTINQCYAAGTSTLTRTSNTVGGLCGGNHDGIVNQCYSTAKVTGHSSGGGLSGYNFATMTNSFWDIQTSGQTTSSGGTGLTTLLMQTQSIYTVAGWDFIDEQTNDTTGIWRMSYINAGYPLLWWQKDIPGDIAGGYGVDLADFDRLSSGWLAGEYDLADLTALAGHWLIQSSVIEPSLFAWWPFNNDAQDNQGSNHGTATNGAFIAKAAGEYKVGSGALRLDGVNDLVNCGAGPEINNLPVMSVAMWIKATSVPATKTMQLIGQRDLSNHIWSLQIWGANSGHITGFVGGSTTGALTETTITPVVGQWYHVAMTYDDAGDRKVRLFVDGVEAGTAQQIALSGSRLTSATIPVTIGDRVGGDRAFGGSIDDVRIYQKVISQDEILSLMDWINFKAYWTMDDNAMDSQGNNHAALTNGAAISKTAGNFKIGTGALKLDGINDLVNCGTDSDIVNMPVMTVAMWIKATEVPATRTMQLMGQRDLTSHIWSLQVWGANGGHITGFVGGSTTGALTETTLTPQVGTWYHLAMTYDDAGDRKVHVYVNGVETGTVQQSALSGTRLTSTTIPLTIGDRIGGGRAFGGNIDDVRVYRRILSAAEIAVLAQQ